MADVANVTSGEPGPKAPDQSTGAAQTDAVHAGEQPSTPPRQQQRVWSMPKSPVNRAQADKLGRVAIDAVSGIAKAVAAVARFGARGVAQSWRAIEAVPSALKLFLVAGILLLLGLVGAIALDNAFGLICTVVVIPVCSLTLGALGHRWYSGLGRTADATVITAEPATSELKRSVEYVDTKLSVALNTFGTERHQQAVIALFQAKTAVELTLGTEQNTTSYGDVPLRADDQHLRPRIRVGAASKSLLRESNSLAAS